jgi:hypothetical protein
MLGYMMKHRIRFVIFMVGCGLKFWILFFLRKFEGRIFLPPTQTGATPVQPLGIEPWWGALYLVTLPLHYTLLCNSRLRN